MKQILVDLNKCLGCRSCEIACAVGHSHSNSLFEAIGEQKMPQKRVFVETGEGVSFPVQCRHCEDPACISACMAGGLHKDPNNGTVLQKSGKCVGCWMCVMVCPFGAIAQDKQDRVIVKCDRCSDLDEPQCVAGCPTKAISFVTIDEYSKDKRKNYLTNIKYSEEAR